MSSGGTLASWTTQQLVAFLSAVSACRDEAGAVQTAAEAVAIATDSEVGAVILGERVLSCVGFGRSPIPHDDLIAACRSKTGSVMIPGFGRAEVSVAELGRVPGGYLLASRAGEPFGAGERGMISAMANVLSLTLDVLRALDAERSAREVSEQTTEQVTQLLTKVREQRQLTLDRFSRIQRAIAARSRLQDVLDAITTTACELVECDVAVLRAGGEGLVSTAGLGHTAAMACRTDRTDRTDVTDATHLGARAEASSHPMIDNEFSESAESQLFGAPSVQAAVAVPVLQGSQVIGHLLLGSRQPGARFGDLEESLATTLAEHAGLAVQDAQTVGKLHVALTDAVHKASHDALTGLANRATFLAALDKAVNTSHGAEAAWVLYIDLDFFKSVNDTYGHVVGDELLVVTAARLRESVGEGDVVARLGGDEFAIQLGGVGSQAAARAVAQQVYLAVCQPARLHSETIWPSVSIGVAAAHPHDTSTALLARADAALYEAKRNGRGQVAVHSPHARPAEPLATASHGGGVPTPRRPAQQHSEPAAGSSH